ncbi:hypothetical protein BGZ65_007434 [Modicella reniformis]|uniref:Uncharacterized protein n=1 Tax=Modicella reniformis TaxID=1440133 RepID=A0A9P6SQE1_9FUNG|nr:hypothetical protein BGZ65_007434 [Modicella reniformis]
MARYVVILISRFAKSFKLIIINRLDLKLLDIGTTATSDDLGDIRTCAVDCRRVSLFTEIQYVKSTLMQLRRPRPGDLRPIQVERFTHLAINCAVDVGTVPTQHSCDDKEEEVARVQALQSSRRDNMDDAEMGGGGGGITSSLGFVPFLARFAPRTLGTRSSQATLRVQDDYICDKTLEGGEDFDIMMERNKGSNINNNNNNRRKILTLRSQTNQDMSLTMESELLVISTLQFLFTRYGSMLSVLKLRSRSLSEWLPRIASLFPTRKSFPGVVSLELGNWDTSCLLSSCVPWIVAMVSAPPQATALSLDSQSLSHGICDMHNDRGESKLTVSWRALRKIRLLKVKLQPGEWKTVIKAIDLSELQNLDLWNCNITHESFKLLVDRIPHNTSKVPLKVLNITDTELTKSTDSDSLALLTELRKKAPLVKIIEHQEEHRYAEHITDGASHIMSPFLSSSNIKARCNKTKGFLKYKV